MPELFEKAKNIPNSKLISVMKDKKRPENLRVLSIKLLGIRGESSAVSEMDAELQKFKNPRFKNKYEKIRAKALMDSLFEIGDSETLSVLCCHLNHKNPFIREHTEGLVVRYPPELQMAEHEKWEEKLTEVLNKMREGVADEKFLRDVIKKHATVKTEEERKDIELLIEAFEKEEAKDA